MYLEMNENHHLKPLRSLYWHFLNWVKSKVDFVSFVICWRFPCSSV